MAWSTKSYSCLETKLPHLDEPRSLRRIFAVGLTLAEFQRSLFGPNAYLQKLLDDNDASIERYYIPTRTADDLLDSAVSDWLSKSGCQPLVVLGGYGTGKSTYAQRLAFKLATTSLTDTSARIPIRIALGNLVQQNNLEGLFGEYLAKYNVVSPNWRLIQQLNKQGRFVIIFDGFDEMKHGMTFSDFERQFELLLTLASGEAKLLILGRDTALRDEREFRAIIGGRKATQAGTEYRVTGRPECKHVSIAPFSVPDAHAFIRAFLPLLASTEAPNASRQWLDERVSTLY